MKKVLMIAAIALLSTGAAFACDGKKKACCKSGDKKECSKDAAKNCHKDGEKKADAKTTTTQTPASKKA